MLARSPRDTKTIGRAVVAERMSSGRSFHLLDRRLAEMALLLRHRHRATIPHTDDADGWAVPLADTLAAAARLAGRDGEPTARVIAERLILWCPRMPAAEAASIAAAAIASPRRWTAADLGDALALRPDEREALGIRTIRPAGHRGRQWTAAKREKERRRAADRRAAAGAKNREAAAAARAAEIAASGVSRAQFYRNRAKAAGEAQHATRHETPTSALLDLHIADARVSPVLHKPETAAEEARRLGVHRSTVIRRRRREGASHDHPDNQPTGPPSARSRARPAPPNTGCFP